MTNAPLSGILLHKISTADGKGIPGVSFILYDSGHNPIDQQTTDDRGYAWFEDLTVSGRYYLRELENEGYIPVSYTHLVLAKGAGHFLDTSIWAGNVCIAGHNRGVRDDFGDLHTLEPGDTVTWTTKLGTRTYEVVSVQKVLETDTSGTTATSDDRLTLYTCVRDQREYRWCVTAVAK